MVSRKGSSLLSVLAVAFSILLLLLLLGFYSGYTAAMDAELQTLGVQIMAVPKGCPYASTTMLLHGGHIDGELPLDTLENIRSLDGVRGAEAVVMGKSEIAKTNTIIYGTTPGFSKFKPHWNIEGNTPQTSGQIMLGSQIAGNLGVGVGDKIAIRDIELEVVGVLGLTGTSDDSFVFTSLDDAMRILGATGLTAVMADVEQGKLMDVNTGIEGLTDAQPVTVNQVATTIGGLVDSARSILLAVILVAILASAAVVAGSSLLGIIEQSKLIGMMRSIGATPLQVSVGVMLQVLLLTLAGGVIGSLLTVVLQQPLGGLLRILIPNAPLSSLVSVTPDLIGLTVAVSVGLGLIASIPSLLVVFRRPPITMAGS